LQLGIDPQIDNWGIDPQIYNWGSIPQIYNWEIVLQIYNWGSIPQIYNWGSIPRLTTGGSIPQSLRSDVSDPDDVSKYDQEERYRSGIERLDVRDVFPECGYTCPKRLSERLQVNFGVDNSALAWFRSYLVGRRQHVRCGGK